NTLLAYDPLLENGSDSRYMSPWRQDRRPLLGLLLGVHAFLAVCRYFQHLQTSRYRHPIWSQILNHQKENIRLAWAQLLEKAKPTALGTKLLIELEQELG